MADLVQYYGTGRRKSAIARVFLRPGTGEWKVNGKAFEVYFVTEQQRVAAKRTLALVELASSFDVVTTVKSGGVAAQADAVKLGVARALVQFNPELRKALKAEGLLTRDSRMKERKKYGQKGARARFQFSRVVLSLQFSVVSLRLFLGLLTTENRELTTRTTNSPHRRDQSGQGSDQARMQLNKEAHWPRSQ